MTTHPTRAGLALWTALAMVSAVAAVPAHASTIANGDNRTYTLILTDLSGATIKELKPGARLSGVCPDGCIMRLRGVKDGAWKLEGDERVTIENSLVFYDGPAPKAKDGAAKSASE